MTKKSAARLKRDSDNKEVDQYFNTNTVFDDLLEIHEQISASIAQFGYIAQLANNKELISRLENSEVTNEKIRLLAIDLKHVIKDLNTSFASHKDRSGGAQNPDEYMWALTTFQNYSQIATIIEGTVIPTVGVIYEEFAKAERKMIAEQNENNQPTEPLVQEKVI